MYETKKPSKSLTIWSAAIAMILALADLLGVNIPNLEEHLNSIVSSTLIIVSAATAIYGRLRANKVIKQSSGNLPG